MRSATRALLAAAVPLLAARPAFAVQEWYDYYLQARDRDVPARRWTDCVRNVDRALESRPASGRNVRTYGMNFIDYLPHYYKGLCLLRQESAGDEATRARLDAAVSLFDREEQAGAVKHSAEGANLGRLRAEAQSGRNALRTSVQGNHDGLLSVLAEPPLTSTSVRRVDDTVQALHLTVRHRDTGRGTWITLVDRDGAADAMRGLHTLVDYRREEQR